MKRATFCFLILAFLVSIRAVGQLTVPILNFCDNCDSPLQEIDFDNTSDSIKKFFYLVPPDQGKTNIWQIGAVNKKNIGSGLAGYIALATDTISFYPASNHSEFIFGVVNCSMNDCGQMYEGLFLSFFQKFQTTKGKDGWALLVSHDMGGNWNQLLFDSTYFSWMYDRNYFRDYINSFGTVGGHFLNELGHVESLGMEGFSGTQNGLIFTIMAHPQSSMVRDTILFKFIFASDSISDQMDGVIFDRFNFHMYPNGLDDVIMNSNASCFIYPNPVSSMLQFSSNSDINWPVKISIIDMNGIIGLSSFCYGQSCEIDVGKLKAGLYVAYVSDSKGKVRMVRFIKD